MVSVSSCTEHVHRNFSYKLLKLLKSIIDSLVRILFNKILRKKQVELLFLKEGINSMFNYTLFITFLFLLRSASFHIQTLRGMLAVFILYCFLYLLR